ncbi:hypothetical protein IL992_42920 [Microbispora sp. NEAU-D428]|uniref:hypothetical protein n=1 Tax=Microbispora sitophila TaxID=2771537 RepID=UPI0018675CA6|nr:hypothetical protein [Microbispora sitophila]MBE3015869.1 hypothetical protein [Microbispora sitophila]
MANYEALPTATSPAEARRQLAGPAEHVLLLGEGGAPSALLTADLLDRPDRPPIVMIPEGMSARDFAASPGVTLLDLSDDIPGIVVLHGDRPVGVMPIAVVLEAIAREATEPGPTTMGPNGNASDGTLAGDVGLPRALARCHAPGCGLLNELLFYDRAAPPWCRNANPPAHRLVLAPRTA